jgi:DNA-binding transcriptional LysR family regulator
MRAIIQATFKELDVNPRVVMEADDTEAIKRLVESGFGYSILPEIALRKAPRYFQVFRIANRKVVRRQALAMVQTDYPRALTLSIARFLQSTLAPERGLAAVS